MATPASFVGTESYPTTFGRPVAPTPLADCTAIFWVICAVEPLTLIFMIRGVNVGTGKPVPAEPSFSTVSLFGPRSVTTQYSPGSPGAR